MFSVNWFVFIRQLVPSLLRTEIRLAWLDTLVSEIRKLHWQFIDYRSATVYKMSHTVQLIYLEKMLNDSFDPFDRGIYIDNVNNINWLYAYYKPELKPNSILHAKWDATRSYVSLDHVTHMGVIWHSSGSISPGDEPGVYSGWLGGTGPMLFLYSKQEYYGSNDFIVNVPSSVTFDENVMRSKINFYKSVAKRYTIVIV